jgi:hypothetical protein
MGGIENGKDGASAGYLNLITEGMCRLAPPSLA